MNAVGTRVIPQNATPMSTKATITMSRLTLHHAADETPRTNVRRCRRPC